MGIVAHTLVKNEESFIWYAINSVIDYMDEVYVWDNGSSDRTVEIIKTIKNPKLKFRDASKITFADARQKMIEETKSDWIFILDGDEVWPKSSIENLVKNLDENHDAVVIPNYMLIGDMFHYQEEKAGRYQIADKVGNYNLRAIRNISGLHEEGVYGNEGFVTKDGLKVQDLPKERILFLDIPYLHASFLKRKKIEIGISFPKDFYYPEVFFKDKPNIVPTPWRAISMSYKLRALFETPLKKIYRRTLLKYRKHGY